MQQVSKPLLVVGGGFAGFWTAAAARRVGGPILPITLVSREPVLQIRPRLYEAEPQTLAVDLVRLLEKVEVDFVHDEVVALDPARGTVGLGGGDVLSFSGLVVATGSAIRRPRVPGAEDAYAIDTQQEAVAFDARLAEIAGNRSRPTIAVVGAGFTGIELALELRDRIVGHSAAVRGDRARIILIDRANVVGRELGDAPRPVIEAALAAANVELRLGEHITALDATSVTFAGESLAADAVVLATGLAASPFARLVPGRHDELGRVVVEQSLRAAEAPRIFVAGDAAAVDGGDGRQVLQSCQHALQLGRFAGENAARAILGQPLLDYRQPPYITCLDLGRAGAVYTRGWDRRVEFVGARAKSIKRWINTEVIYPPVEASRNELLALSSLNPAEQRLARLRRSQAA